MAKTKGDELDGKILSLIQKGVHRPCPDSAFNALALELFEYQFSRNRPYRRYSLSLGKTPEKISHWKEIPAIPTRAFKEAPLASFPQAQAAKVFYTSGTILKKSGRLFRRASRFVSDPASLSLGEAGESERAPYGAGRHYLENLKLYEASLWTNFKAHFTLGDERWSLAILAPSPKEAPHSSLCHMMGVIHQKIGMGGENPFFIRRGEFLIKELKRQLEHWTLENRAVMILGTAFSFVHFLDHAIAKKWKIKLPPGSRIMETGGYKGRSRELSKQDLYPLIEKILGVPKTHIINEYGMTEMCSQFYDDSLLRNPPSPTRSCAPAWYASLSDRPRSPRYARSHAHSADQWSSQEDCGANTRGDVPVCHKTIPPWVRTRILDPVTLEELPAGEIGLLEHFDLANRSSVMAILTEDIGVKIADGFEILGRAPLAEPRGCSMGMDSQTAFRC